MSYKVRFTREAEADLLELYDFLAERNVRAAVEALATIAEALRFLEQFPFSCRKAHGAGSPLVRELVIAFGASGYVALFEIDDARTVTIIAVRHQRESDFH